MDIQEQRIAEAKRRLAHAYREAGDAYIAKQVEIGINMVVPVGVIADLLTEMVWEPPVDLKVSGTAGGAGTLLSGFLFRRWRWRHVRRSCGVRCRYRLRGGSVMATWPHSK